MVIDLKMIPNIHGQFVLWPFYYNNIQIIKLDIEKVLIMLLIHDIVELDAGNTFLYSSERNQAYLKEEIAANRIFGILENDQKNNLLEIWKEFEAKTSKELLLFFNSGNLSVGSAGMFLLNVLGREIFS
jgi:5'-deoxynucleotidase YfbR-like HD superfamily hydrolase